MGTTMISHLDAEAAARQISPSFRAWMLGRLLLAAQQSGDLASSVIMEKYLSEILDDIVSSRASQDSQSIEHVDDPLEAWGWAYLLNHYCGFCRTSS